VERCTVAAFPAALREINSPKAKTERIIAISNRALPARHVVRPSITPKRWQLHDQSIRREDVVMPEGWRCRERPADVEPAALVFIAPPASAGCAFDAIGAGAS
jgi:hypothetical protein